MMDQSVSSQTVTESKVGRKKRKLSTVEETENDNALCGRKINTRSKTKVNTDNKDSDDTPTTPSSTTSSKSGKSSKRNKKQAPMSNDASVLESQLSTIEYENRAPATSFICTIPSRSAIRNKKQQTVTASNDVNALESHLSTIICEANAPVTSLTTIPSKSAIRSKKLPKTDAAKDINILEPGISILETNKHVPETIPSSTIPSKSGKGNKKSQKVSVQRKPNVIGANLTVSEIQTGVAETRDVENNNIRGRGRPRRRRKIITNNCLNEPVKSSDVSVLKTCNLIPTVKIEQLSFKDCMKLYKVSEQRLNPGPSREEKLDNSNTSNTQEGSDFLKSKVQMKKRKYRGLLSDVVVHNLRRKVVKNRHRKPAKSPSYSNLNLSTTTYRSEEPSLLCESSQYPALENTLPLTQVDNGVDDPEQFSKILRHKHASIKPISIKINIDSRKQERVVEFAKPLDKPISNHDRNINSATFECNVSDSSGVTSTSMPYAEYYCIYNNDWSYNINEESLLKVVSDNILFTNSELSSEVACQLKSVVENSKTQDDVMSTHSSFESSSAKSDFQFVKPCKRPPTRHKSSKSSSYEGSFNSVTDISTPDISTPSSIPYMDRPAVDDDIISIYSHWSIRSKDFTQSTMPASRSYATNQVGLTPSPSMRVSQVDIPSTSPPYDHVTQWLEQSSRINQNQIKNRGVKYVPPVFKQLCYNIVNQEHCPRTYCKFVHNRDVCLSKLNLVQLQDAYEFAKSKPTFFIHLISSFVNEFAKQNSSDDLVSMVRAVIFPDNSKQVLHVRDIICALQQTGYTYETVMEELITCYRSNNFDILNILLKIVFENENNLSNNWSLVQKLCEYRNYAPIDPALVNRVMGYCYRIYNIDLCVKLVEDIFKRDLVNPRYISGNHFSTLITLLKRHNLKEADVLVHIAQLNNIPINFAIDNGIPPLLPFSNNCSYISPTSSPSQITYDTNSNVNNFNHIQQSLTETNTNSSNICWTTNNFPAAKHPVGQRSSNISGDYNHNSSNSESGTMKDCGDEEFDNEDFIYEHPRNIPSSRECNNVIKTLSDSEIKKLDRVISCDDHETLIAMYNDYKNISNSNSFVLNVVGLFKKQKPAFICNLVQKFLEGLEKQNPDFPYLLHAEATLYSLVFNTIGILKQLKGFTEAATMLHKFRDCLENLTKVHWFRSVHNDHPFTIIGKYLYFCQIFTRGKFYSSTLHILKSPELQLLHSSTRWNLPHAKTADEKFRNRILHEFILATLQDNLDVAKDIILYIMMMRNEDTATEIDTSKYFDKLILAMLNNNKIEHLIEMLPNILQGWYKYLKIPNMKALLITLVSKRAPETQLVILYSKCCLQGIYPQLKGNETTVSLTTDMTAEEIFITLRYFFAQLLKNNFQVQEILISIKMPHQLHDQPTILIDSQCGIKPMMERTLIVLTNYFPSIIIVQICGNDLKVKAEQLKRCMESYRKSHSRCFWARQSSIDRMGQCKY